MSKVIAIVAMTNRGAIGFDNKLLKKLPKDMARFKRLTSDHTVVMGRKTFESIGKKALPNRFNVVLTNNLEWASTVDDSVACASSMERTIMWTAANGEDVYILGGAKVYESSKDYVDEILVTVIDEDIKGDTYFPTSYDLTYVESIDEEADPNCRYLRVVPVSYEHSKHEHLPNHYQGLTQYDSESTEGLYLNGIALWPHQESLWLPYL